MTQQRDTRSVHSITLKADDLFAVLDTRGNVDAAPRGLGLYRHDTRFLSQWVLHVNGTRLAARTWTQPDPAVVSVRAVGRRSGVSVHQTAVMDNALHIVYTFHNPSAQLRYIAVSLDLAADFRDLFEIRGIYRGMPNLPDAPELSMQAVRFCYRSRDGALRSSSVTANRAADRVALSMTGLHRRIPGVRWEWTIPLAAHGSDELAFVVVPHDAGALEVLPIQTAHALHRARTAAHTWTRTVTAITTDHAGLNALLRRSSHDLRALLTPFGAGEFPAAGIPLYVAPFGRDACITALEALMLTPRFAAGTLRSLAEHQGAVIDPSRDEEPGKILHEVRVGELARLGIVPHARYYGSVDSTPLFVMLFAAAMRWLDDDMLYRDLLPHVRHALDWCDRYGDADGDGYIEYGRHARHGAVNQGWKDSGDSLHHPDGSPVARPVALVEVQGYVVAAKRWLAAVVGARGEGAWAAQLGDEADALTAKIERDFWLPDEACYAYALDRDKRPVRTVVSNAGHLLLGDVPSPARARLLARRLMQPDLRSGWGIRTLSTHAARYNPDSYHNGSIWPHDNALIALGMARAGARDAATTVVHEVLGAGFGLPLSRLPELYAGYERRGSENAPMPYPVSCAPQAWSAASVFAFVQAMLGLDVDGREHTVHCDPAFVPWLNRIEVRGMQIGHSMADIDAVRDGAGSYATRIAVR